VSPSIAFFPGGAKPGQASGKRGASCTIGTEITHAGCNWMGAMDEYLVPGVARTSGSEKTNSDPSTIKE
jgi:hypothetical protein